MVLADSEPDITKLEVITDHTPTECPLKSGHLDKLSMHYVSHCYSRVGTVDVHWSISLTFGHLNVDRKVIGWNQIRLQVSQHEYVPFMLTEAKYDCLNHEAVTAISHSSSLVSAWHSTR